MKKNILRAIRQFKNGERPDNYRKPDWSHVIYEDEVFPAKAIWSLANKVPLAEFNTNVARDGFAKLGLETIDIGKYDEQAEKELKKSKSSSASARLHRLSIAPEYPKETVRISKNYIRNADVILEVLYRAKGKCEKCKLPAPFKRATNGTPFLEVHHKQRLADGGKDTVKNAEALCPNCHREKHFG